MWVMLEIGQIVHDSKEFAGVFGGVVARAIRGII
jgi:hypothetical protein